MKKIEVKEASTTCFEKMDILLANRYREPLVAFVHPKTKNWLGFLKLDFLNPNLDALTLLYDDRKFTLQLQDSNYVLGKIEKSFDFPSTISNRKLVLKVQSCFNMHLNNSLMNLFAWAISLELTLNFLDWLNVHKTKNTER